MKRVIPIGVAVLALTAFPNSRATAQAPRSSVLFAASARSTTPDAANSPQIAPAFGIARGGAPDHRWEGAAIGALVAGTAMTFMYVRACESDCVKGGTIIFVGSAALGAIAGALIGGAIPKT